MYYNDNVVLLFSPGLSCELVHEIFLCEHIGKGFTEYTYNKKVGCIWTEKGLCISPLFATLNKETCDISR